MDKRHFDASLHLAARLADGGHFEDAITAMRPWVDTSLDDFGKVIAAVNIAVMNERLGRPEEALGWYDYGLKLERGLPGVVVAGEHRASLLERLGRREEARAQVAELAARPALAADVAERIARNLKALR